jgi:hypothetical protein
MAKRNAGGNDFNFEVLSKEDADRTFSRLGARKSKYQPVIERAEQLEGEEVLSFAGTQSDVTGVRNYLNRYYPGRFQVAGRKSGDNQYRIFVSRAESEQGGRKRGRPRRKND